MSIGLIVLFVLLTSLLMLQHIKTKHKNVIYFILISLVSCSFYLYTHHISVFGSTVKFQESVQSAESEQPLLSTFQETEENILRDEIRLEAPLIKQLPELPRGCELVSLNMLLAFNDVEVDKLELAENVKRNPASFEKKNGKTYFGNPNNGFVGDMLSLHTPGLGVYHEPITDLAKRYADDLTVHDFTGESFEQIEEQISLGRPVWVIINSHYRPLPDSEFITWHTEDGPIEITYREHSVLITGYDDEMIYFNDPLDYRDRAPKKNFIKAWEQMGRQAITIY